MLSFMLLMRFYGFSIFLPIILWGFCITGALAQSDSAAGTGSLFELSIEELLREDVNVSTVSKRSESVFTAPNVVHVITQKQIKDRGYRSLAEVLQAIPGFSVFHRDYQFVAQVRGIAPNDNEKINFMINGYTINQMTEPEILNGPINLSNVERVEVITGPGSVLYGAESLTAIVNIITRNAKESEVSVTAGNYNDLAANVLVGKSWAPDKSISFSMTAMQRSGWDAFDSLRSGRNYLEGTQYTGQVYPSFFLTGKAQLENFHFFFASQNQSINELNMIARGAQNAKRYDQIDTYGARYIMETDRNVKFVYDLTYDNKRMIRRSDNPGLNTPGFDLSQSKYSLDASLQWTLKKHFFQTGVQTDYYQNRQNYTFQSNLDTINPVKYFVFPIVRNQDTYGFGYYISENLQIFENLKAVGAIRFDYNSVLQNSEIYPAPRLALLYTPANYWHVKLMYNEAVRMPAPWMTRLNPYWDRESGLNPESFYENPLVQRPERLKAVELQNTFDFKSGLTFSTNFYYQELRDFISWYGPFTNVGNFYGSGAEADIRVVCSKILTLWGNASYTNSNFHRTAAPRREQDGVIPDATLSNQKGEMIAVPKVTSNLGMELGNEKFFFAPTLRYFTLQPAKNKLSPDAFYIRDQFYLDAAFTVRNAFVKGLDFRLSAQNILDNRAQLSSPFQTYTYSPRGVTSQFTAFYRF